LVSGAVAGPDQLAEGELEVLDLVAVAVPVRGAHRVEVAGAVGGEDVGRDIALVVDAGVARPVGAARGVEGARDSRVVAARARGEAGAAAPVHRVAEARAELGEVPRAPVLAAEVGVAREAGERGAVAADARHLALLLRAVVQEPVEGRNRGGGTGGLAGGGSEEDLPVEHLGRE